LDQVTVFGPNDDIAMAMVAVAEFKAGELCADPRYRPRIRAFMDAFLGLVEQLPYDAAVMAEHVKLLAWTHQHGCPRSQHDLIIAATSIATDRTLLTLDRKAHFEDLPGLKIQFVG